MKTTFFPKKYSIWLLKQKWLWFKTMIPITTFDGMDIDKTITYHKGYKHFIFRRCIACNKFINDKNLILKSWFSYFDKKLKHKTNETVIY